MRKSIVITVALAALCISATASAEEKQENAHPFRVGFGMDLGVPSGAALGLVVHPKVDWASVQLSLTHNVLNFGGRASLKLDPMALINRGNLPIGLFADAQGGFAAQGTIPGHSDLPSLGYDYLNLYGGLRLGKPNGFHWNFEVGPTYMHINTDNFQAVLKNGNVPGLSVGNPTVNGWLVPTFVTGFEVVWP